MWQNDVVYAWEGHNRRILDDMVNGHRRVPQAPPLDPSSTRHTLGFSLATALSLFIVFSIITFFSCCYHWDKIRQHTGRLTAQRSSRDPSLTHDGLSTVTLADSLEVASSLPSEKSESFKQNLSLPVVMPGDEIPRYIAWPSPHGFQVDNFGGGPSDDLASSEFSSQLKTNQVH